MISAHQFVHPNEHDSDKRSRNKLRFPHCVMSSENTALVLKVLTVLKENRTYFHYNSKKSTASLNLRKILKIYEVPDAIEQHERLTKNPKGTREYSQFRQMHRPQPMEVKPSSWPVSADAHDPRSYDCQIGLPRQQYLLHENCSTG